MNFDFTGKKVLVTGAATGIGYGIASALAKANAKVYAVYNKSPLDELVKNNPTITPIKLDISDWDKTKATIESLDCLDGVVNNAVCSEIVSTGLMVSQDILDKVFSVNINAAINIIQTACKKMIAEKRPGSIVNMSSIAGDKALPNTFAYSVSKAGLDMVTKQFALELGPNCIRINSVLPTMVRTERLKTFLAVNPLIETNVLERTPMPRTPEVEDIVGPVMYLLSDCSAMVTGTLQPVDAGIMCNITTRK